MTPAEELAAAAFQLRNPFHLPGLKVGIDTDLAALLANWLEREGRQEAYTLAEFGHRSAAAEALAVARFITQPRPAVSPCMCGYPDDPDVHHPTDGSDCRSISDEPIRDWVADLVRDLKQP